MSAQATNLQQDWLSHKSLMIMKGIARTPGDQFSAEVGTTVVDLMSGSYSLDSDNEWSPQIATVKNGGVWAESPINDGRRLLAAPVANVTEKITVIVSGSSYLDIQHQLVALNQMVSDCRDYWQGIAQIEPIQLMWEAGCAPGAQYALLYNIEIALDYISSPTPAIRASLTLEREPYWRGIPVGANPRIWTYYVNASHPQFNSGVATLVTLSDHLITQTVKNKHEWSPTAYGLQTTAISKNYIEITADQVPGDAPALVEMALSIQSAALANIYIGKTTKQYSGRGHDNVLRATALNLNAGDGNNTGVVVKTVGTNLQGVISNGSAVAYSYGVRTSTGIDANWVTASQWGSNSPANGIKLDREFYRGTFAVFARAQNNSSVPVLTDMRMRVFIEEFEDAGVQYINSVTLPEVNPPLLGPTVQKNLVYMGTVTLPLSSRAVESPLGYGIQLQEVNSNLRVTLQQRVDVATANRIFEVLDLIFMPIDEGLTQVPLIIASAPTSGVLLLDNTGYFSRGDGQQIAVSYATNANSGGISQEVRGADITLTPRKAQRLYFIQENYSSPVPLSAPDSNLDIKLNIVPRWTGIRDV